MTFPGINTDSRDPAKPRLADKERAIAMMNADILSLKFMSTERSLLCLLVFRSLNKYGLQ
jgi:hypothetical protein